MRARTLKDDVNYADDVVSDDQVSHYQTDHATMGCAPLL